MYVRGELSELVDNVQSINRKPFQVLFGLTLIGRDRYLPESSLSFEHTILSRKSLTPVRHGESSQSESWDRLRDDVFGCSLGRIPVRCGMDDAKVVTIGSYINSG